MQTVEIYSKNTCGFCHAAKRLLSSKSVTFVEFDLNRDPSKRKEMIQRSSGGMTVPQIFIGGTHVGGCDDLFALEKRGHLDTMLAG